MPSFVDVAPVVGDDSPAESSPTSQPQEDSTAGRFLDFTPSSIWKTLVTAGLWAGVFCFFLEGVERNVVLSPYFLRFSERLTLFAAGALSVVGTVVLTGLFALLPTLAHLALERLKPRKTLMEITLTAGVSAGIVGLFTAVWPRFLYFPFVAFIEGLADKGLPLTTRLSNHPFVSFAATVLGTALLIGVLQAWVRRGGLAFSTRTALAVGLVPLVPAVAAFWLSGHYFVGRYEDTFHVPLSALLAVLSTAAMLFFLSAEAVGKMMLRATPIVLAVLVAVAAVAWFRFDANQNVKSLLWRRSVLVRQYVSLAQKAVDWDGDGFSPIFGGGDADDRDPNVNPLAVEIPGNGRDENGFGGDGAAASAPFASDLTPLRAPETPAPGAPKRNVLFLSIDALRADHMSSHGYSRQTTPNLDRFASRGLNFMNCLAQATNTGHSFSSIMTSSYGEAIFDPDSPNLATVFKSNGYKTVFLSKRIMGELLKNRRWSAYKSIIYRGMDVDDQIRTGRKSSDAKTLTDKVIEFLQNHKTAGSEQPPFYAWVHFTDPHARYVPHSEFNFGQKDIDLYDGEIAYADFHLGRLFSYLESSGQLDNTLIIITADHGEAFGEHGAFFHASRPYRNQANVPLILRAPGAAPRRVEIPVASLDISATALAFTGIRPPETFQGVNLLEFARASAPSSRLIVTETPRNLTEPNFLAWGVTDTAMPDWRLMYDAKGNTWELYNVHDDPEELRNLIDERPTEAARLKREFGEWMDIQSRHPHFQGWGPMRAPDENGPEIERKRKKGEKRKG